MSIKRVQDVIAYVQKIGARAAFNELRQCGVLRTNGEIRGRDRFGNTCVGVGRASFLCSAAWLLLPLASNAHLCCARAGRCVPPFAFFFCSATRAHAAVGQILGGSLGANVYVQRASSEACRMGAG